MVLERVNSPDDVKKLSTEELRQLAQDVRKFIIDVVTKTGGHLASSLGVVELTLALLKVFSPPKDEIIWDVGHQSYPYKILTGRKEKFYTLRQYGGISGFPSIKESPYDVFGVGHSSTSISAALGIRVGKKLKGEEGHVIAVIGDGALTAGEAYEGLNNAGQLGEDLIVILNDNEMSISKNIGAISNYLTKVTTGEFLRKAKHRLEEVTKKIFGEKVYKGLKRVEDLIVKGLFPPGMLFEELGFRYVGPIDGHDLDTLIVTLENVSKMSGPTLVHVITKKGKGYEPAEEKPERFHGISPKKTNSDSKQPTYTEVFSKTLIEIGKKYKDIVAITAAMPSGTGLDKFKEVFPERYYDVGIAEQHAVTFAAGMAKKGLKPVVAIYSTFLQRAFDQIVHDVALQELPVVFAIDRAGLVGEDGATHHGAFDLSYLRIIPNMVVAVPKDEEELRHLLYTAVRSNKPFAVRYPRGRGYGVLLREPLYEIPIGTWEVLRKGKDMAILANGWTVYQALDAAKELEKLGISVTVVNARYVKPLDEVLLRELAKEYELILTVEENTVKGGFGSTVDEFLAPWYQGKLVNIGLPDEFIEHGDQNLLRRLAGIDKEGIKKKVMEFLKKRASSL
ncbi:1-deoxy-D-xylulose-5-phosphate synthase [Desulfurobacterium thermolithotrophum DSM 11699]|uniref:1-deoxy-D-xylulose-5-phosphate synthase n=1 Tax=Desulfurobacterium thermolithotrophum (strain DSM 11699 / BSA) TaxID=868864 RepID=F0S0E0_DESTD|nr:1-deoxy-D-xylulose-5-phosphate synthase [Desulfurobacterium thermolithotrophum]ADY72668.1 1-deoxy-D-xylulose-5-phosphate synthase [Desulfurobacterium thermolithotrophum DSM 11699]